MKRHTHKTQASVETILEFTAEAGFCYSSITLVKPVLKITTIKVPKVTDFDFYIQDN